MDACKTLLAVGLSAAVAIAAAQTVTVDGKTVAFDAPPKMVNGTLMVPIRNMFDAMGADMEWKTDRQVITGLRKGNKVEIWIGSREARYNDKRRDLDEPPFVLRGRTYAPLKFLADSMNYMVSMEHGAFVLTEKKP